MFLPDALEQFGQSGSVRRPIVKSPQSDSFFSGTIFTPDPHVTDKAIRFRGLDGHDLGGILYEREGDAPSSSVVFSTGGGTRAFHYRHFAMFLASMNIPTLLYDYRGIGLSRGGDLKSLDAGFEDWAEYDAGGAIACMRTRFPDVPLAGVAHSIGCLLLPAAPNSSEITQYALIAPNVGYLGDYPMPWRPAVYLFYALLMPQLTRWLGYFPAKQFRAGEDLPARIAMQWGSRTKPHFDTGVLGRNSGRITTLLANLKRATGHALILSATDDRWAGETGIRRYVFAASSLQTIRRSVSPAQADDQPIGHWGYFRRRLGRIVWPILHRFLAA